MTPIRSQIRVLLFEDDELNQELMQVILPGSEYQLVIAENGFLGLELFSTSPEGHFHIILMDIQMPELDGYETTKKLREWELESGWARTPILALTAYTMSDEVAKILSCGCDDHLAKPVQKDELLSKISFFL